MSADEFDITFADGYVTPGRRKNNWLASNTPTSAHGSNFRYETGSQWVHGTNTAWVNTDPTLGAAVWWRFAGIGSGDTSVHTDLSVSGGHTVYRLLGATHDLTLTGNATIAMGDADITDAVDYRLIIRQDGTGNRTITWSDTITWVGGSAPTLQTGANAVDTIGLLTLDGGSTFFGYHSGSGGASLGTTVATETAFGQASDAGSASTASKSDHTHGTPTTDTLRDAGRWELVVADVPNALDLYTVTSNTTIADTTTETTMFGGGVGSLTLPVDFFTPGRGLMLSMRGQLGDTGTPTFNVRVKVGTTTIASTGAIALTGITGVEWMLEAMLTCRGSGPSGAFIAGGLFDYDDGTEVSLSSGTEVNVDTRQEHAFDVTWEWGTADPSNTITVQEAKVRVTDPDRDGIGGLEPVKTPAGDDYVFAWVTD